MAESKLCPHGVIGPCQRCGTVVDAGEHEDKPIILGKDYIICKKCGHIRPHDGWKSKCRGSVGISLGR